MPALAPHLTDKGQRLYHIHRNESRDELTPKEFVDSIICCVPIFRGDCRVCGNRAKLCGGFFCVPCTAGAFSVE